MIAEAASRRVVSPAMRRNRRPATALNACLTNLIELSEFVDKPVGMISGIPIKVWILASPNDLLGMSPHSPNNALLTSPS